LILSELAVAEYIFECLVDIGHIINVGLCTE